MTAVNIDLLEEPDGRYRLTARIAGVTYLTDRFALRTSEQRLDYTQLLAHEAALVLAARPTPDSPEFEYDTRTRFVRALQAAQPEDARQPGTRLPTWMREGAVVQLLANEHDEADHGWIKGFLDTGVGGDGPTSVEVMVYRQTDGLGLHHPDSLNHLPDPPADILAWIDTEKSGLSAQSWRGLRQRSSGVRVYRLDQEAELLASGLVPRGDLSEPHTVDIDLWSGPGEHSAGSGGYRSAGSGGYRDDLLEPHHLTLRTADGELHTRSFGETSQVHAQATALLLDACPDPEAALPGWHLRTDEDRLLEAQLSERGQTSAEDRVLPVGLIVRTPATGSAVADFGRVDHLLTAGLVAVVRVGQGPALFPPEQLEPYTPSPLEQTRLDALDRQIRHDVRARAEREAGSVRLTASAATPDLY